MVFIGIEKFRYSIVLNVIADTFCIHRTTASAIVTKYKKKKPSNLVYDLSKKKYVKGYTFERIFLMNERSLLYLNAIDVIYSS